MPASKNLGFIKAIHSSSIPPVNIQMLWYDTNVNMHKYYDTLTSTWVLLAGGGGVVSGVNYKGDYSCVGNPNYPSGLAGDLYRCSSSGKVGGVSGKTIYLDDFFICIADNGGGTEGVVGSSWKLLSGINSRDKYYTTAINLVADTPQNFTHNLGKKPSVSILNSSNKEVIMSITHSSDNIVNILSKENFAGTLICN